MVASLYLVLIVVAACVATSGADGESSANPFDDETVLAVFRALGFDDDYIQGMQELGKCPNDTEVKCDGDGRITELSLWGLQLTGTIPTEIGLLTELRHLDVSTNELWGNVPSQLGDLPHLDRCFLFHRSPSEFNAFNCPLPAQIPETCLHYGDDYQLNCWHERSRTYVEPTFDAPLVQRSPRRHWKYENLYCLNGECREGEDTTSKVVCYEYIDCMEYMGEIEPTVLSADEEKAAAASVHFERYRTFVQRRSAGSSGPNGAALGGDDII